MKKTTFAAALALLLAGCSGRNGADEKMSAALARAKQDKWDGIADQAAEISEAAPNAAAPKLLLALACERTGEFDKALDLARKCAEVSPDDFAVQYTFGRLSAVDPMRRSEAFAILEHALGLRPGDRNTLVLLCNLGTALNSPKTGKYLDMLRADKELGNSGRLWFLYGLFRARQGNKNEARIFFRQAVRKDGKDTALLLNAARAVDRYKLSEPAALEMYRQYLDRADRDPAAVREVNARIAKLNR